MSKRIVTLAVSLIIALLLPITVLATYPATTVNSATFYCDAVVINYTVGASGLPIGFHVFDGPSAVTANNLGSVVHGTTAGTFNMMIPVSPQQTAGTTLYIIADYNNGAPYYTPTGVTSGNCTGLANPEEIEINLAPPAYRLFGGQGARASIFIQSENNGANNPVLALYDVNEDSQGSILFYMSLNIAGIYEVPAGESSLLIYKNPDELIQLHLLASGEYQVNLGPDCEGKMHVLRFKWDGGEPYDVTYNTYFVGIFNRYAHSDSAIFPI